MFMVSSVSASFLKTQEASQERKGLSDPRASWEWLSEFVWLPRAQGDWAGLWVTFTRATKAQMTD